MSSPMVFDVAPEVRLATLFDLVEKCADAQRWTHGAGESELDAALGEFRKAAGEQIRALSARLASTDNRPRFAPVAAADLKVGDEVWIRGKVESLNLSDERTPVEIASASTLSHYPAAESIHRAV